MQVKPYIQLPDSQQGFTHSPWYTTLMHFLNSAWCHYQILYFLYTIRYLARLQMYVAITCIKSCAKVHIYCG